jgi:CxxC motif-containing protein (DUF1111 family)
LAVVAGACGDDVALPPADLGGDTTRSGETRNAFSLPAPTLSNLDRRSFEVGDSFFNQNWVRAPASADARDGLGPTFNAQACSSCHPFDGRGAPPDPETPVDELGLLLRLSVPGAAPDGGPLPVPVYGDQLQDRAIDGVPAEGTVTVEYHDIAGQYGDGTPYTLREPRYRIDDPAFGPLPDDLLISPRLAPQIIGSGLLEAVPAADIEARADPDDADGDAISGRPNYVPDLVTGESRLGRFGWKANVATIEGQVTNAFHGDIGITSSLHPTENCPDGQDECAAGQSGTTDADLEITDERLGHITFYTRTLSVPAMRTDENADTIAAGSDRFAEFGCASCHTPTLHTGESAIAALADQTIHPYTDLLLHDMGPGLTDSRPDHGAAHREWRTPPLWGIGLIDDINGERFLLHDGRARTLEEAILWHGNEGADAQEAFRQADKDARDELIAFLEAL